MAGLKLELELQLKSSLAIRISIFIQQLIQKQVKNLLYCFQMLTLIV